MYFDNFSENLTDYDIIYSKYSEGPLIKIIKVPNHEIGAFIVKYIYFVGKKLKLCSSCLRRFYNEEPQFLS